MNIVTIPSYFVSTSINKKKIIAIILALQMAQTPSTLKSKVEIVLDVSCINLAPHVAIMLIVHSLHLIKLIVGIDKEELKQNITIKCGWNAMNNLNIRSNNIVVGIIASSLETCIVLG